MKTLSHEKILVLIAISFACTSNSQDTIISRENLTLTQRNLLDHYSIDYVDLQTRNLVSSSQVTQLDEETRENIEIIY